MAMTHCFDLEPSSREPEIMELGRVVIPTGEKISHHHALPRANRLILSRRTSQSNTSLIVFFE